MIQSKQDGTVWDTLPSEQIVPQKADVSLFIRTIDKLNIRVKGTDVLVAMTAVDQKKLSQSELITALTSDIIFRQSVMSWLKIKHNYGLPSEVQLLEAANISLSPSYSQNKCNYSTEDKLLTLVPLIAGVGTGIVASKKYKKSTGKSVLYGFGASILAGTVVQVLQPNMIDRLKCNLGGQNV